MHLPVCLSYRKYLGATGLGAVALALILSAMGCTSASAAAPPLDRFERLQAQDLRVARVSYRLSIANAARCGETLAPQLGFVVHGIAQYGLADREAAARRFGLGTRTGVMAVIEGSPAQNAGLMAGDQLISVNGRALPTEIEAAAPSRATVDQAQSQLIEEARRGAVTLRVAGQSGERDVTFVAAHGCPSTVELIAGNEVNAWADGQRIMIGEGLLRQCASDADLALVIGHEMAHNLLHHGAQLAAHGVGASAMLPVSAIGSMLIRKTEEEADELAVRLAGTAAYDLSGAEAFLGRVLKPGNAVAATHPATAERLTLLRTAIAAQRGVATGAETPIANTAPSGLVSGRI